MSRKKLCEKNIVLAISKEIKKEIDKIPGFRAVLTRTGDYYLSFSKRLKIARDLETRPVYQCSCGRRKKS